MARLTYILDTNVIADRMKAIEPVSQRLTDFVSAGHRIYLCQPVYYEIMRSLLKINESVNYDFSRTRLCPC